MNLFEPESVKGDKMVNTILENTDVCSVRVDLPCYVSEYLDAYEALCGERIKATHIGGGWWKFENFYSKYRKSSLLRMTENLRNRAIEHRDK